MTAETNFWSWAVWIPIIVTLASGTVSALASKVVYDTKVEGKCGDQPFQKAYFFTACMFIGEFMCLGLYHAREFAKRRREAAADSYAALSGGRDVSPRLSAVNQLSNFAGDASEPLSPVDVPAGKKPPLWVYAVLCVFDLSATAVGGVGLVWVDASSNQMLRGSMIVFCAIFSVIILKRKLSGFQWGSIGVVCLGLIMVGLSGMLKKKYEPVDESVAAVSSSQLGIGILLVLIASALNAVQGVFEEKLLKAVGGAEVDALELVGWEGFFGLILSAFLLLPIVQHIPGSDCGKAEDTLSTAVQLSNSPMIVCLTIAYILALFLMNWQSQVISQMLSSVHRNLVSAVRTVLVWVGSIILYYTTKDKDTVYGEKWTNWSWLEMGGFFMLVAGTILYSYFGLKLAKAQADAQDLLTSPEYVLPHEPTLAEHTQVIKQQARGTHQQQHGGAAYSTYGRDVYDEDQ